MFPDAHKTLDRLKELGGKLALITNAAAQPQRAKVVAVRPRTPFRPHPDRGRARLRKARGAGLQACDGSAPSRPARDLDGRRQPRMGSRHPATSRHLRDLARRLRRRPALRLPDPPRPHHLPPVGIAALAEQLELNSKPAAAAQSSSSQFGSAFGAWPLKVTYSLSCAEVLSSQCRRFGGIGAGDERKRPAPRRRWMLFFASRVTSRRVTRSPTTA